MTLVIEKSKDLIQLKLTTASDKKPLEATLTPAQVRSLIGVLNTATTADTFKLHIEI